MQYFHIQMDKYMVTKISKKAFPLDLQIYKHLFVWKNEMENLGMIQILSESP